MSDTTSIGAADRTPLQRAIRDLYALIAYYVSFRDSADLTALGVLPTSMDVYHRVETVAQVTAIAAHFKVEAWADGAITRVPLPHTGGRIQLTFIAEESLHDQPSGDPAAAQNGAAQ